MALQKINTDLISADAVTAAKIADGAITADDIGANNITGAKIASNSILTRHIDDDQVTGDQLANAITVTTSVTSPLVVAQHQHELLKLQSLLRVTQSHGIQLQQQMLIILQLKTQHSLHQVMQLKEQSYK
jgi:hypothetical protein